MSLLPRDPVSRPGTIRSFAKTIAEAFQNGGKLFICGNGGSAAMSQHMAAEFMVKFKKNRKPLPAIALSTDTSFITACSNDYPHGFTNIFARQIIALGQPKDILVTFSTSGLSPNITAAEVTARSQGLTVITMPRKGKDTARIQEYQLKLMHKVVECVEDILF